MISQKKQHNKSGSRGIEARPASASTRASGTLCKGKQQREPICAISAMALVSFHVCQRYSPSQLALKQMILEQLIVEMVHVRQWVLIKVTFFLYYKAISLPTNYRLHNRTYSNGTQLLLQLQLLLDFSLALWWGFWKSLNKERRLHGEGHAEAYGFCQRCHLRDSNI